MWGLPLAQEGADLVTACRQPGLLVNCTHGNIIRLLPPLVVQRQEVDAALAILTAAFEATFP